MDSSSPRRPAEQLQGKILLVDDDASQLVLAREILIPEGHAVDTALSGEEALQHLGAGQVDVVVADLMMPGMSGFDLLEHVQDRWSETAVIFLTGHADVGSAVQAIKQGAENYVTKPFDVDQFRIIVAKALENKLLRDDNARLRRLVWDRRAAFGSLVGQSATMQAVYGEIETIGPTESTVLILGESGTGKELIAREIHQRSRRAEGPFVAVNCGALPANLLESELFGHVRGAFTGAATAKVGLFEAASGGTIFLDEIGATSAGTQQSLLRVLQEREIRRVGDTASRTIDVRVVSATNADLESEMRAGTFRSDVYFRLSGVILRLPPLRRRDGDIELLAQHFLQKAAQRHKRPLREVSTRGLEKLRRYSWPGNVRELENVIERSVIFATERRIGPTDLVLMEGSAEDPAIGESLALDTVIRAHLSFVLKKCGGNKLQAARLLEMPRTSLYKRLKRLGLDGNDSD